eukprot:Phypoly_transcript_24590.p1 GENE.Phypoly_transcript_24590~~Phypoly_transcript_24590.p1  ORF type:complete len:104 (+),score=14.90 Phypoly_transcript_24590:201-512(+)
MHDIMFKCIAQELPCHTMDFDGQKQAELFFQIVIALFGLVGWVIGFILQDFKYTLFSVGLGTLLALASCLPDWPTFNRMELKWQKPRVVPAEPVATKAKGKSK